MKEVVECNSHFIIIHILDLANWKEYLSDSTCFTLSVVENEKYFVFIKE